MTDNTEQKEFWNDLKGDLWVELQTKIDPMLAVFDQKLMEVLDVQKGCLLYTSPSPRDP